MLKVVIPRQEVFNEEDSTFSYLEETTLQLEHSLVSISRWESIWHKPFLIIDPPKTREEWKSYIMCMTMTQNVRPEVYNFLTTQNYEDIKSYVDDSMTATWFHDDKNPGRGRRNNETITSEYLYYMMIDLGVPMECQKWHLNRLMTLLRICAVKSQNGQKPSKADRMQQYSALKAARRAKKP